jgi:hypothetical protein
MDPAGSDDHRKAAAVMVRLSDEYAEYARGDANTFAAAPDRTGRTGQCFVVVDGTTIVKSLNDSARC